MQSPAYRQGSFEAAIDGSVIRGTLTATTGEQRDFDGWLELSHGRVRERAETKPPSVAVLTGFLLTAGSKQNSDALGPGSRSVAEAATNR